MKIFSRKNIIIALVVFLCLLVILTISITAAYLSSRRNVEGYLNFASGISIDYKNINASANSDSFGNLLYFDDENTNSTIDEGELKNLTLTNIQPGDEIKIANPTLTPLENTATFALRAKLVVTNLSDSENPIEYITPEAIDSFLSTGASPLFASGNIEFADNWEFNSADNYHYYVLTGDSTVFERLVEVGYDSSSSVQQEIALFKGDALNSNLISCVVIDGEPIEELPASSVKIELFIEAIQYTSIQNWNV